MSTQYPSQCSASGDNKSAGRTIASSGERFSLTRNAIGLISFRLIFCRADGFLCLAPLVRLIFPAIYSRRFFEGGLVVLAYIGYLVKCKQTNVSQICGLINVGWSINSLDDTHHGWLQWKLLQKIDCMIPVAIVIAPQSKLRLIHSFDSILPAGVRLIFNDFSLSVRKQLYPFPSNLTTTTYLVMRSDLSIPLKKTLRSVLSGLIPSVLANSRPFRRKTVGFVLKAFAFYPQKNVN